MEHLIRLVIGLGKGGQGEGEGEGKGGEGAFALIGPIGKLDRHIDKQQLVQQR
jgi:hypothetical protein